MGKVKETVRQVRAALRGKALAYRERFASIAARVRVRVADEKGQGTTEYAILVGILVVIAILAITVFRPKLQELWDAIASGINSL